MHMDIHVHSLFSFFQTNYFLKLEGNQTFGSNSTPVPLFAQFELFQVQLLEVYGIPTICFITAVHWLEFSLWSRLLGERERRKGHPNNVWHSFALFTGGVNSELLRVGGFVRILCDIRFICIMSWDHRRWCHFWIGLTVADTSCAQCSVSCVLCARLNVMCPVQLDYYEAASLSASDLFTVCSLSCAVNIVRSIMCSEH